MKRYKIYHYNKLEGYQLVDEINVRTIYDNIFWHKSVPTIGERRCRQILKKVHPWMKVESIPLLFEDVESGRKHVQELHKNGTIILE